MSAAPLAQQAGPSRTPRFKAAADVVEVDAIVEDSRGAFVDDLSVDDFEIREDGRPQPITAFYLLSRASSAPLTATGGRAATPRAQAARPASTFVVVFDTDHLTVGDFKRVQTAAHTFLHDHFQEGDIGGVVVNTTMAGSHLTSNREELLAAIDTAKMPAQGTVRRLDMRQWPRLLNVAEAVQIANDDDNAFAGALERACVDEPTECLPAARGGNGQVSAELIAGARGRVEALIRAKARQLADESRAAADRTGRMLEGLFNGLGKLEGRKQVILLSDGYYSDYSSLAVRDIVARAVRANARVYSLDARGIGGPDAGRDLTEKYADTAPDSYARMLGDADMESDAPNSLAVDTGGFVVRNANVFDSALARIARDAGDFYVLGYRPAAEPDGRFHSIQVVVKRPGLHVRARRGYIATPGNDIRRANASGSPTASSAEPSANAPGSAKALAERSGIVAIESGVPDAALRDWVRGLPGYVPPAPTGTTGAVSTSATSTGSAHRLRPDARRALASLTNTADPSIAPASNLGPALAVRASEGWAAYQRGDVEHARDALDEVSRDRAAPAWARYALGQAEYALTHYDAAIRAWEAVRHAAPEFEPVYFDLADAEIQRRDNQAALAVLRAAQQRWPKDAEALNAIGVIEVREGALDAAVNTFKKAVEIAPSDGIGVFNLAKTYELRYNHSKRYVRMIRQTVANEQDLKRAREWYQKYLEMGGPFEASAREGLERLDWAKEGRRF